MEAAALKSMIVALLAWVHLYSGYPVPAEEPELVFVPRVELQEIGCPGPCPIMAWFPEGQLELIYVLEGLDFEADVCSRAVLVHELVHFAQEYTGSFSELPPRERIHAREIEALQIQNLYLAQRGRRLIFGNGFGIRGLPRPYC